MGSSFCSTQVRVGVVLGVDLKEIRGEAAHLPESKHLEPGGLLDLFVRRCLIVFNKMLFNELAETFRLFGAFQGGEIPPSHFLNNGVEESISATKLFGAEELHLDADTKASESSKPNTRLALFLKYSAAHCYRYMDDCTRQRPIAAIESLHDYFHCLPTQPRKPVDKAESPLILIDRTPAQNALRLSQPGEFALPCGTV
jgi:hypothetical protein